MISIVVVVAGVVVVAVVVVMRSCVAVAAAFGVMTSSALWLPAWQSFAWLRRDGSLAAEFKAGSKPAPES